MPPKKYCCCYPYDYGITIMGFLQMWAALFFWARFSTINPYYWGIDLAIALCYSVRTAYFILDHALDSTLKAR